MPRLRHRRSRLGILGGMLLVLASTWTPVASVADETSPATLRLPDLKVVTMRDFHIGRAGGRRVLRFTGAMWNAGSGPLEVRASRARVGAPWDVDQIVYDRAGHAHRRQTAATMHYAGDGHDHFHVQRMLTYHLWGASGTYRDAKIGFCFFDTDLIRPSLARSPAHATYHQSGCAHRGALHTRNGISVGWADTYPWDFAFQWIDISGLTGGTYTIRTAVDLFGDFQESNERNNCAWATVRFGSTGSTVKVLARGASCINDHSTTPYAADVAWALTAGVSAGCAPDMFCTNNRLTRGQAASFISRAFALPPATADYFSDDTGHVHEDRINRMAEAGLMTGCTATHFCPDTLVTRGQTAQAVAMALALPPATEDHFDDDTGSVAEPFINSLVEAGIWSGCGERIFCPTGSVTRGQMAQVLHHAIVPPSP